jgi:hypothetical protein
MSKLMKNALAAIVLCAAFASCKDPKAEEKTALDDIIKIHDKVMGHENELMHNKMKLDTLLAAVQNDVAKTRINELQTKLAKADSAMSDWMQNFEPEQKGKTHEQIMTYFADQKKQVAAVDSLFDKAVKESSEYLKPFER